MGNDTTKIDFDDNSGKGNLTMLRNPFGNGRKYYGKFDRETITMDQIIARIQKRELGTNALMVQHITGLLKAEILEALSRGEAVNVLGLGVIYISADASAESGSAGDVTVTGFSAGFTPSSVTNAVLKKLSVRKITVADNNPSIERLFDTYDEEEKSEFAAGARVRMTGSHLKLGGNVAGIYLCPVDGDGNVSGDEGVWTAVGENLLKVNSDKKIEFIIPRGQKAGGYRVLLRTSYAGGAKSLKTPRDTLSDVIGVAE